jgi:hypothetical protein
MKSTIILSTQFIFLVIFLISGCDNYKNRVPESRLIEQATLEGNRISAATIQQRGIPAALDYCSLHAYPLVDSIEQKYGVKIKRASMATRNQQDAPDPQEIKIIELYLKDIQQGKIPEVSVKVKPDEIHFAKPILLNDVVCLNCHGRVGTDITEENYRVIKALYPEDKATGHKLGDLRGIWSIKFNRKDLEKGIKAIKE